MNYRQATETITAALDDESCDANMDFEGLDDVEIGDDEGMDIDMLCLKYNWYCISPLISTACTSAYHHKLMICSW